MLVICPECKGELSEHANTCPSCGIPSYKIKESIDRQITDKKKQHEELAEQKRIEKGLASLQNGFKCAVCDEKVGLEIEVCLNCKFSTQKSYDVAVSNLKIKPVSNENYISYNYIGIDCPKCNKPIGALGACRDCDPAPKGSEHIWHAWKFYKPKRDAEDRALAKKIETERRETKERIQRNRLRWAVVVFVIVILYKIIDNLF